METPIARLGLRIAAGAALAVVALAGTHAVRLLSVAGALTPIAPHGTQTCSVVGDLMGVEDIALHPSGHVAYLSADDRRADPPVPGGLYTLDLQDPDASPVPLPLADGASFPPDFHPHGLGLWVDRDGSERLWVVNHPRASLFTDLEGDGPRHTVEAFDRTVDPTDGTVVWTPSLRLTDPLLISPNDVAPVGPDELYITNDHGTQTPWSRMVEDYGLRPWSNLLHARDGAMTVADTGLRFANGVLASPDGRSVHVAAVIDRQIRHYRRSPTGQLTLTDTTELTSGPDNLSWDAQGSLWVATHPKMLDFARHAEEPDHPSASQVLRLVPRSGTFTIDDILVDDGRLFSGASVAVVVPDGRLLVGSVFSRGYLECHQRR